jgi:hypothetical protein
MSRPPIDDAPTDIVLLCPSLQLAINFVQRASSRRARVLRVLSESHRSLDTIRSHLRQAIFRQWPDVPKRDIWFMRRGSGRQFVQKLGHPFALQPGPFEDRAPATNLAVLLLDLGGAPFGYCPCNVFLEG